MMMKENKIARQYRLSPEILNRLDQFSAETGKAKTLILEEALLFYFDNEKQTRALADVIIEQIDEKYKNYMTRVRLASRQSDINSQVILEILNFFLLQKNYKKADFVVSDKLESPALSAAKEEVKNKIAKYKQDKDSKGAL